MFKLPALMGITHYIKYMAVVKWWNVDHVFMYKKIHDYYTNVLEIPDWRIKTMKGEEIVAILHLKYRNENLNVYIL